MGHLGKLLLQESQLLCLLFCGDGGGGSGCVSGSGGCGGIRGSSSGGGGI